jgi:hypothetical protein
LNSEIHVSVCRPCPDKGKAALIQKVMLYDEMGLAGYQGMGFEADRWGEFSRLYRRLMGLALERKRDRAVVEKGMVRRQMNTAGALGAGDNGTGLSDLKLPAMLR